jgi:hypothetical protein
MNEHRWAHLGRRARAFRVAHAAFSIVQLAALGYVWFCAATRRRDRVLTSSAAALLVEGAALVIGRGDCPFGPLQARLGDPVPLFELVLPRRAAKAAIPALFLVAVGGLVATLLRPPRGLDAARHHRHATVPCGQHRESPARSTCDAAAPVRPVYVTVEHR